jgi:hypothetical protein
MHEEDHRQIVRSGSGEEVETMALLRAIGDVAGDRDAVVGGCSCASA